MYEGADEFIKHIEKNGVGPYETLFSKYEGRSTWQVMNDFKACIIPEFLHKRNIFLDIFNLKLNSEKIEQISKSLTNLNEIHSTCPISIENSNAKVSLGKRS